MHNMFKHPWSNSRTQ